jgi:hypothetical protein
MDITREQAGERAHSRRASAGGRGGTQLKKAKAVGVTRAKGAGDAAGVTYGRNEIELEKCKGRDGDVCTKRALRRNYGFCAEHRHLAPVLESYSPSKAATATLASTSNAADTWGAQLDAREEEQPSPSVSEAPSVISIESDSDFEEG